MVFETIWGGIGVANLQVLVVGAGGREHALVWALARSSSVRQVYVAPGNAGQWSLDKGNAEAVNVPITAEDTAALVAFAREHKIDLTVIGPEVPLAAGIVDVFQEPDCAFLVQPKQRRSLNRPRRFPKLLCSVIIFQRRRTVRSRITGKRETLLSASASLLLSKQMG